jgi:hypothetical protein
MPKIYRVGTPGVEALRFGKQIDAVITRAVKEAVRYTRLISSRQTLGSYRP